MNLATYSVPCKNHLILFEFDEASFFSTSTYRVSVQVLKTHFGPTHLSLESINKGATDELPLLLRLRNALETGVELL